MNILGMVKIHHIYKKFDVDNSDGDLYWHQYMTNVSASKTEGQETRNAYRKWVS